MSGCVGGDGTIRRTPTYGAFRREWMHEKKQIRDELRAGNYRFSLLTRITLKDGEETDRGGPGCLNRFSASISGASAGVRLPSGVAAG